MPWSVFKFFCSWYHHRFNCQLEWVWEVVYVPFQITWYVRLWTTCSWWIEPHIQPQKLMPWNFNNLGNGENGITIFTCMKVFWHIRRNLHWHSCRPGIHMVSICHCGCISQWHFTCSIQYNLDVWNSNTTAEYFLWRFLQFKLGISLTHWTKFEPNIEFLVSYDVKWPLLISC